jgi:hypothetical protein
MPTYVSVLFSLSRQKKLMDHQLKACYNGLRRLRVEKAVRMRIRAEGQVSAFSGPDALAFLLYISRKRRKPELDPKWYPNMRFLVTLAW